jgi:hypothetical protein
MTNATLLKSGNAAKTTVEVPVQSIFAFARGLGSTHRKSLTESEELHKSYVKMNETEKRITKAEFMVGYMSGVLNQMREVAETIITGRVRFGAQATLSKPARTKEQQNAYDAARKMFGYHIARDDSRIKLQTAQPTKPKRLSGEFKDAAAEFVGTFYEEVNAAAVNEVIKMLQEFKKRLSAKAE